MARRLTKKQKEFADKYVDTGNATKSALQAYDTEDYQTAATIANENMKKPEIVAYMENHADRARSIIADLAENAQNENVKLQAAREILDRTEGKPVQRQINANADTDKQYKWAE